MAAGPSLIKPWNPKRTFSRCTSRGYQASRRTQPDRTQIPLNPKSL